MAWKWPGRVKPEALTEQAKAEAKLKKSEDLIYEVCKALLDANFIRQRVINSVVTELSNGAGIGTNEHLIIQEVTDALHAKFADVPENILRSYVTQLVGRIERFERAGGIRETLITRERDARGRLEQRLSAKYGFSVVAARKKTRLSDEEKEAVEEYKEESKKIKEKLHKPLLKGEFEKLVSEYETTIPNIRQTLSKDYSKLTDPEKTIRHQFFGEYAERKKGVGKALGREIPHVKIPRVVKKSAVEGGRIFGGVVFAIIGFVLSAVFGIQIFVWGFILLAFYFAIPGEPDVFQSTLKRMEKIRDEMEREIIELEKAGEVELASKKAQEMESRINVEKMLGEGRWKMQWKGGHVMLSIKQLLKIFGIGVILIGIGTSGIPLAPFIAMIGGFLAYFSFTTSRSVPEEEEKKEGE